MLLWRRKIIGLTKKEIKNSYKSSIQRCGMSERRPSTVVNFFSMWSCSFSRPRADVTPDVVGKTRKSSKTISKSEQPSAHVSISGRRAKPLRNSGANRRIHDKSCAMTNPSKMKPFVCLREAFTAKERSPRTKRPFHPKTLFGLTSRWAYPAYCFYERFDSIHIKT